MNAVRNALDTVMLHGDWNVISELQTDLRPCLGWVEEYCFFSVSFSEARDIKVLLECRPTAGHGQIRTTVPMKKW
jgi:hypothetical protein